MVLFTVVGELGSGKTLGLTSLCWQHWFFRREKIFSNYHLFGIPYFYVESVEQLDMAKDGFLALDEFWRLVDSYYSRSKKAKITADILARSRKRGLTYCMTAQVMSSISPRIRQVMDFTAYPIMNKDETIVKILIFRGSKGKKEHYLKSVYFRTTFQFDRYETNEEVDMTEESAEPLRPVFQESYNKEHGYLCNCEKCKTQYFETWEQADKYGENFWKKHQAELKYV